MTLVSFQASLASIIDADITMQKQNPDRQTNGYSALHTYVRSRLRIFCDTNIPADFVCIMLR